MGTYRSPALLLLASVVHSQELPRDGFYIDPERIGLGRNIELQNNVW